MNRSQSFSNRSLTTIMLLTFLSACSGGGGGGTDALTLATDGNNQADTTVLAAPVEPTVADNETDIELRSLIAVHNLSGDASIGRDLPSATDPIAVLGRELFFSKSLGGGFDSACVTCHHPSLGGGDQLLLPVGVGAENTDLLGPGREHVDGLPLVPRNSPTVFNVGLWDSGLFWDSRVESLNPLAESNGAGTDIRTPDTPIVVADSNAGANLTAAQARFPVTSVEEMKTDAFETDSDNAVIRDHLAARIGNYGVGAGELGPNTWLSRFQEAFNSADGSQQLITFDRIAHALGEYERSMVFTNNPWRAYVQGDNSALTEQQKQGAILFFTAAGEGGGGCSNCHSGDLFSDGEHHLVAFPQFGPGKGDGNNDDFGRERETGDPNDRYRFRTPSLLNVEVTAPYGHAGVYASLNDVLDHYNNAGNSVDDFFDDAEWCDTIQFSTATDCENLYPDGRANSEAALRRLNMLRQAGTAEFENTNLNNNERNALVAFLRSLTDPCVQSRECLSPWIPDNADVGPDGNQLNAIDRNGILF